MKKVLILAYDFPPYVSVGGLRPYNWFKYLKEFGVEPIVVTRQWENHHGNHLDYVSAGWSDILVIEENEYGTILRSPYKPNLSNNLLLKYGERKFRLLRMVISGFYEFAQFFLPVGPKIELYKAARGYLENNKVDAIVATGDPFVLFHYSNKLSKEFGIPWLADYRDPWSQDIPLQKKHLLRIYSTYQEKRLLKNVKTVITVSEFVAQKIKTNYTEDIHILLNGYDPELIEQAAAIPQQSEVLSIGYAGTLYNWHPIESFFKSLNEWLLEKPNYSIRLNFYGVNNQSEIEQLVKTKFASLAPFVNYFKRMPNKDLLYKLGTENILLLFNYYSFMGTKIYDYLGMNRKILFCFTDDQEALVLKKKFYDIDESSSPNYRLQADLIEKTESGILVKNNIHLKEVLTTLAEEFYSTGRITSNSKNFEQFSRKLRAKQLSEILSQSIKKK